jgi:hypothetical protein
MTTDSNAEHTDTTQQLVAFLRRTSGDVLRNFGGRSANGLRGMYERLLKLGYGFTIMASVPLIMDNFQAR